MPPKKPDVLCSRCGSVCRKRSHINRNKHMFCSMECYLAEKTKKISVECDNCGKTFLKKRSDIARSKHNYCSHECEIEYRRKHRKQNTRYLQEECEQQHRLIVERIIGRKLLTSEQVHHIDGNSRNNDPSNLMVVTAQEHSRIHASQKRRNSIGQFVSKTDAPQLPEVLR